MRWGFCVFPSRLFVHILSLGANPSGFGTAFGRFGNFGYYCLQVRVARALCTGALAFGQARVIRRRTFACNCGNPAQIAARLSRLQRSSPNGGILFRTADFFPNCEVLLRTADLFPNDGVPSRAAWFFVQLRKFLPNGGVLAGLACPRGLAWRTLPRHRRRVQGGKFG